MQGQLDPEGQRIAQVVRKATSLPKENIEERIADCTNRMSSDDNAVAEEAAIEYSGLLLAHQFVEDITESKAEEKALRESIKEAKADLDAGTMEADAYREYVESTNDAIRQNKIERAEAYRRLPPMALIASCLTCQLSALAWLASTFILVMVSSSPMSPSRNIIPSSAKLLSENSLISDFVANFASEDVPGATAVLP